MVGWKCRRNLFVCVHACACVGHACVACIHAYTSVFISLYGSMFQHAYECKDPAHACAGLCAHTSTHKPQFSLFWLLFTYFFIQRPFLCSFFFSLLVLPPFLGSGSNGHISFWYKALASFEPVLRLLLESHASAILVQSLVERWWNPTHTFHIAKREMIVTPYDFHRMTCLRCDGLLINLEGESSIQLGIDLLGWRHMTKTVCYFDLKMDHRPLPQEMPKDCA